RIRDADLPGLSAQLGPEQREDAEDGVPEGKLLEILRVVRIRELDPGFGNIAAARAQYLRHRVAHPLGLLRVAVVDKQNARSCLADVARGHAPPSRRGSDRGNEL